GYRSITRALVLKDFRRMGFRRKLEPRLRIGLAAFDLLRRGLTVCHRVEPLHLVRHFAVGDGLDLQRMQLAKIGYLVKGERSVFDQPYGGRLGHQRCGHAEFRYSGVPTGQMNAGTRSKKVNQLYNGILPPREDEWRT